MSDCVVAMQSRTAAERGRRTAALARIDAEIVSIDQSFTKRGCSVGVKVRCDKIYTLTDLLDKNKISYGDIIGRY